MNRRNFVVTTALLAAVAVAPTACKKDGGGGASGASGDMLSYLPKDSAGVIGISWAKARKSSLFKKYEGEMTKNMPGEVAKIKSDCGIDLVADINTIVVAGNSATPENSIVAVKGAFDQAKVEECIGKMGGKAENGAYTIEGDVTNAFWASKDTVLLSEGLSAEKIKGAAAGGSLNDNAELMGLIGKVDTSATMWAAGQIPPDAAGMFGMLGGTAPKSAYMSLTVDSGLNAKAGLVFEKEEEAETVGTALKGMMTMAKSDPQAKELLGGVSAKASGKTVTVKAKLSGGQLEKLQGMAGGMPF